MHSRQAHFFWNLEQTLLGGITWVHANFHQIGQPHAFYKTSIGKKCYTQTGPAQSSPVHPPHFFSNHQTITRTIANWQFKEGVQMLYSFSVWPPLRSFEGPKGLIRISPICVASEGRSNVEGIQQANKNGMHSRFGPKSHGDFPIFQKSLGWPNAQ